MIASSVPCTRIFFTDKGRHREICIVNREDLIWMKRFRNSKQDIADIEALENEKNTENP